MGHQLWEGGILHEHINLKWEIEKKLCEAEWASAVYLKYVP